MIKIKRIKIKAGEWNEILHSNRGCKWCLTLYSKVLGEYASNESRFQVFSATKRYRFLSIASCHPEDVKIICCIAQVISIFRSLFYVNRLER